MIKKMRNKVEGLLGFERMEVDLHGYPVWQALEVADEKVKEAWENGCRYITLIHGAPEIRHHKTAWQVLRGGIKWGLRGKLARGEWMQYAYQRRSRQHVIEDGFMTLRLRKSIPKKSQALRFLRIRKHVPLPGVQRALVSTLLSLFLPFLSLLLAEDTRGIQKLDGRVLVEQDAVQPALDLAQPADLGFAQGSQRTRKQLTPLKFPTPSPLVGCTPNWPVVAFYCLDEIDVPHVPAVAQQDIDHE